MRQSSWFLASCLLLACICALSNAQIQTFTGTIYYHEPSMGIGVLNGTITYDYVYTDSSQVPSYYMDFGAQVYSVLYQYNYVHGLAFTSGQWRYRSGPGCPGGCETGALKEQMPQLFVTSAAYTATTTTSTINGVVCTLYTPKNSSSSVSQLYVAKANTNQLCQAVFANNNTITFLTMTAASHPITSGVFTPPTACSCGKPIDLSIVLDRSGSVLVWQFKKMVSFLQTLASTFKISSTQAQWAISEFNTLAWNDLTISSGNSPTTVNNVINALNCTDMSSKNDYSSCRSGSTSISAGIQLGAYQLAPARSGVRSYATKVLILLTDGYHNTMPANNYYGYTRCYPSACGDGDTPCGDTNPADGITDDWEPCVVQKNWRGTVTAQCANGAMAQCQRDLINAREYCYRTAGDDLFIFALGVGQDLAEAELKIVTDNLFKVTPTPTCGGSDKVPTCVASDYVPCGGKVTQACIDADDTNPERVILTSDWNSLGSTILQLTSLVCDSNAQPCGNCCGYCACGICSRPDYCPTTNYCDLGVFLGNCCSTTPRVCSPTNACYTATCDRTANNGAGGCVQTAKTCPADDACYHRVCDPNQQGACVDILKAVPPSDLCHISACTNGVLFNNTQKVCTGTDACRVYSCDLTTGNCKDVAKQPPAAPPCKQYNCNSAATGGANPFYLVDVVCPNSGDKCNPLVCNNVTGQCETKPTVCNDPANLCDLTKCDSSTGNCTAKTYKNCPVAPCQDSCNCTPSTGVCSCVATVCKPDSCITKHCNATGVCVPDFEICPAACANSSCGTKNNQCFTYQCNGSVTTEAEKNNCDIVTNIGEINCKANLQDHCLTNATCDPNTGCKYDKVVCGTPPTCKEYISNSSLVGCCQEVDKDCDKGDPCYDYGCNMTTGECYANRRCIIDDLCTNSGCYPNGTCWQTPIVCTSSDPCRLPLDCAAGVCLTVPKNCSDGILCTADSCNATTGQCIHIPCSDGNPCTIDTCDSNGACVFPPRNCTDNNLCTIDTCNSSAADNAATDPCVHVTVLDSTCDDNNQCTDDMCLPQSGCVNVVFNATERCPLPEPCSKAACFPTLGCQNISRTCYLDPDTGLAIEVEGTIDATTATNYSSASDCSYATCEVDPQTNKGECTKVSLVCGAALTTGVITAVALGAGVIVGIIIAALVCVGASGGGAFAAYQKFGGEGDATLNTNPLYEAGNRGGANPLWETPTET